jgi:tetraprenyl-beta-curcumene synthase
MFTLGDPLLVARMGWALVLANARYWSTVAPLVRTQLNYWGSRAEGIPDPALQEVALANLREEGFNAQATATLATLAPRKYRKPVVEAVVGLQVIYDYLDSLVEQPLADPLGEGRRLYHALVDAVVLHTEPKGDYYAHSAGRDDGGYLEELVSVVRGALMQLPCRTAIAEVSERAAERCANAQVRAHAVPALGRAQLKLWARRNAVPTGLGWREFLAGAVSSGLALHALIAAAADPRTSREQALAIDDVYLSVCSLTTLLDSLIDYEQDIRSMGQPGYIRYYKDRDALAQGLGSVMHHAATRSRDTPNGAYHLMTLVGVVAYYSSAPTASSEFARAVTEQIRRELRPIITPTLAVMRAWRIAKRAALRRTQRSR